MSSDAAAPSVGGGGGEETKEQWRAESGEHQDKDSNHARAHRSRDIRGDGEEEERAEDDGEGEVDRYGRHRPRRSRDRSDDDDGEERRPHRSRRRSSRSSHRTHRSHRRRSPHRSSHRRSSGRSPSYSPASTSSHSTTRSRVRSRTPPSSRPARSSSPSSLSDSSRSRSPSPSSRRHRRSRRPRSPPKFDPKAVEEALKAATRGGPTPLTFPTSVVNPALSSLPFTSFPHPAGSTAAAAESTVHLQLTRPARRLFVGNLPSAAGLSEGQLSVFFTLTAQSLGIATPQPVLSSWLSTDAAYGFVEFRSVLDATRVLEGLDRAPVQMLGRPLRVARPADYQPPPPQLLNFIAAAPPSLLSLLPNIPLTLHPNATVQSPVPPVPSQVVQLLSSVAAPSSAPTTSSLPSSLPPTSSVSSFPAVPPSRVLLLLHLVTAADLLAEDWDDLVEDIRVEVERFGQLKQLLIPRGQDFGADVLGRTFLHYEQLEEAQRAKKALHGRAFSGRTIDAREYDEDAFIRGELSL